MRTIRSIGTVLLWVLGTFSVFGVENNVDATNVIVADKELNIWRAPEWSTLEMQPGELDDALVFKAGAQQTSLNGTAYPSTPIRIHTIPQTETPKLAATLDVDGLAFNVPELPGTGERSTQIQFFGFDPKKLQNNDLCLYVDVLGPVDGRCNFYFEGRFEDGAHYWKRLETKTVGERRTFAFAQPIPSGLSDLFLRFDFFKPGEYKLYSVRVERETDDSLGETAEPEMTFYLPFDGTDVAEFAAGKSAPTRSERLEFVDGIAGKAANFNAENNAILQFETAKNLKQESGAISVWVKPDADGIDADKRWRTILSEPWEFPTRIGSGALWFWIYEGKVRGDSSDLLDQYATAPFSRSGGWRHIVYCWNRYEKIIYVNGKQFGGGRGDGLNLAQPSRPLRYSRTDFPFFCVGNYENRPFCGAVDELKIFSAPISEDAVERLYREYRSISLEVSDLYRFSDESKPIIATVRNGGPAPQTVSLTLFSGEKNGNAAKKSNVVVAPLSSVDVVLEPANLLPAGRFTIAASQYGETLESIEGIVFDSNRFAPKTTSQLKRRERGAESVWTRPLNLKLMETIDPFKLKEDRIVFCGEPSRGELDGRAYLETAPIAGDRFAIRLQPLQAQKLYCFEWVFPDDKKRSVDIIAQQSGGADGGEYELQTGYLTGDEYPNSHKMKSTHCLYWTKGSDVSLVFMSARSTGAPDSEVGTGVVPGGAALAEIRVYEVVGDLPAARVDAAEPVDGQKRELGIYFEDPAINYDFAADGSRPDEFPTMMERLIDYMNYSGQNFLAYPVVWYNGPIGPKYQPRPHLPRFAEAILTVFDRTGQDFMATINQNNISFDPPRVTRKAIEAGLYGDSVFSIWSTGTPHPGGWHGTPPIFNPLHPDVQQMTLEYFDEMLKRFASHPSFKGIILHLPRHSLHSFGDIRAGYNDYMIERFEKDTGIVVPVDKTAPNRGKLYADWLLSNKRDEWIDWRCRVLADWYKTLAAKMAAVRPDLRLGINCMIPILYEPTPEDGATGEFWAQANREAGIDPQYYADCPNIFLEQTAFPADYRWMENRSKPEIRVRLRKTDERFGLYETLSAQNSPWVQAHDRYWESAIGDPEKNGGKSLVAPWFKEHTWRVSTLNPIGAAAMRSYIMPLRYFDTIGLSKGGFLIGTYGMERELANFAAAFRALPAERFLDVVGSTQTIVVRSLTKNKKTWFYVVNTTDEPTTVEISGVRGVATDLAFGENLKPINERLTITLEPYSLRSFQTEETMLNVEK